MSPTATLKVLLLAREADPGVRRLLDVLARAGHDPELKDDPREAEQAAATRPHDVLLFDAVQAGDGFVRRLRRRRPDGRVVAWLGAASPRDAVATLLEQGADEVLYADMGDREVLARVAAAATRPARNALRPLSVGDLQVDLDGGDASWAGRTFSLTPRELEVLHVLAESAGRAVRREAIYRRVWGYTMARGDRSVDVNVKRLRAKVAELEPDLAIATLPGVGYRLDVAPNRTAVTSL